MSKVKITLEDGTVIICHEANIDSIFVDEIPLKQLIEEGKARVEKIG